MSNRFSNRFFGAGATVSRLRKSWRCASLALVLLTGATALTLSGCGGGGGGGSIITLPDVTVTFQLVNGSGAPANGTLVINNETLTSVGTRIVKSLQPGTYAIRFTVGGVETSATITIGTDAGQTYVLTQGVTGTPGQGITVSGRLFRANVVPDACNAAALGYNPTVLIRVRRQEIDGTTPIVASTIKPIQSDLDPSQQGNYIVTNVPDPGPVTGTYIVEVRPLLDQPATTNGQSGTFSISTGNTSITGINVCVKDGSPPGGAP